MNTNVNKSSNLNNNIKAHKSESSEDNWTHLGIASKTNPMLDSMFNLAYNLTVTFVSGTLNVLREAAIESSRPIEGPTSVTASTTVMSSEGVPLRRRPGHMTPTTDGNNNCSSKVVKVVSSSQRKVCVRVDRALLQRIRSQKSGRRSQSIPGASSSSSSSVRSSRRRRTVSFHSTLGSVAEETTEQLNEWQRSPGW